MVGRNPGSGRQENRRWSAGTPAMVGRKNGGGRQEARQWLAGTSAVVGKNSGDGRWQESSQIPPFSSSPFSSLETSCKK
ncbi:hypothetical protein MA16_Dca019496 [Dendrobium catenatum]|uniref:Uncharacterized protein n=1 Tax=Dendrobium catenatum TaxID=906689 RepID=A0A2I0XJE6_9ASPA|nr:hypothetical protein MA16_Dca019496 [Dendrobium catenatum]